jgi:hypothetical protein
LETHFVGEEELLEVENSTAKVKRLEAGGSG